MHLSRDSIHWVSESLHLLYSADQIGEVVDAGLSIFHRRFGTASSGIEEISFDAATYRVHGAHLEAALPPDFAACVHDHPGLTSILGGARPPVIHLSRHLPLRRWEKTDQYQGIARPMGWRDQMALLSYGPHSVANWCFWRDKLFSADEARLVELIQTHFHAIWLRAQSGSGSNADRESVWINLPADGPIHSCRLTAKQRWLFRAYFPHHPGTGIPDSVARWHTTVCASLLSLKSPDAIRCYAVDSARGRLLVRFYAGTSEKPPRLRLIEHAANPDVFQLRRLGLTTRECEVLHWIIEGKRDAEIGSILNCAGSTVSKHIERILQKLHVETRTSAASAALLYLRSNLSAPPNDAPV